MADVKWVKISTDIFDNRKINYLLQLPNGYIIVLLFIKLITLAGVSNSNGAIFITENIPYTPKMLADKLMSEESIIKGALQTMEELNMIEKNGDFISITNWEEYQNTEGLEKIREQTKERVAKHRERKKGFNNNDCNVTSNATVTQCNVTSNVTSNATVTQCNATEEEIEEEIENNRIECVDYKSIVDLFNQLCPSFPTVKSISDARKKAIKARLNSYTIDDFRTMFIKAEASSFLKGANNRNWMASFDWLIKDSNIAKVLDGNYDDKINEKPVIETQKAQTITKSSANFTEREFDGDALARELFGRHSL